MKWTLCIPSCILNVVIFLSLSEYQWYLWSKGEYSFDVLLATGDSFAQIMNSVNDAGEITH